MTTLLCTADTLVVLPKSKLHVEDVLTKRFQCQGRTSLPTDFKGLDVAILPDSLVTISQQDYLNNLPRENSKAAKADLHRSMTDEELKGQRQVAGKLAWVPTATSLTSSFAVRVSLKGHMRPLHIKISTEDALRFAHSESMCTLRFKPLEPATTHIRRYTDGAYQNLDKKQSQIGFVVMLSDQDNTSNIIHWHSSRAPRRPSSTEESELLALDAGLRCIRNLCCIMFQLLRKEVPLVLYIDNQALWDNLMNTTATSLPEVIFRCREYLHDQTVTNSCLIPGDINPADAFTKDKPNNALLHIIQTNHCGSLAERVPMLQTSPHRHSTFIPTSSIPMPDDELLTREQLLSSKNSYSNPVIMGQHVSPHSRALRPPPGRKDQTPGWIGCCAAESQVASTSMQ